MGFSGKSEKGNIHGSLLTLSIIFLSLAMVGLLIWRYFFTPPSGNGPNPTPTKVVAPSSEEISNKLIHAVNQKLQDMDLLKLLQGEVLVRNVSVGDRELPDYQENFRMPSRYSDLDLDSVFGKEAQSLGASLTRDRDSFTFSDPSGVAVEITFLPPDKPRICLIIDDGGYQKGKALEHLYGFKVPVTVSIIPDVEFSKSLAEEFPSHGVEVMCHMPMEGHEVGAVGGTTKRC